MDSSAWRVVNPAGKRRVIVTKELPGRKWIDLLEQAGCRIEIGSTPEVLTVAQIKAVIGEHCDAAIGQLTEAWDTDLFAVLQAAGGRAYSNYAVGFNNVNVAAATRHGIPVGNTPGVLTETTAEMAVALTFAAARRVSEAERFLRDGRFRGWLPNLFLGDLLQGKTLGVVGTGRIGQAYACMMVAGHKMNLIYHDLQPNPDLEGYVTAYNAFLTSRGKKPVTCRYAAKIDDLLSQADCVSLHTVLDESTHHLINTERLALMKKDAVLINTSRGPVIDEAALVSHCRHNPDFKAGLDVFEHEPDLAPGLSALENVVIVPHIASATRWTREGMALLAAHNVAAMLKGYPVWGQADILPFLGNDPPKAAPSILNARQLGLAVF
jgi:hydroxypyruvate reductase 1